MCSYRTYVPMIACLLIPGFELRAALRRQPGLALRPAALSPGQGEEPLLGAVTAAAERLGVRPGRRMGEALATCPELVLVEQDPAGAEQAWEEILRALEDSGFAVDSGRRAWGLARGGKTSRVRGRRPPAEIVEALEFPEAVGNELTLRRAFGALLEALLARPERGDRFVRKIALSARLVGRGSWRPSVAPRRATTEPPRLEVAPWSRIPEARALFVPRDD